jgi:ABC-type Fe3+/spermidine/putrescine transport system ATPase subunit
MNEGELIQVGTPRDVYQHPYTRFVAEFIGETNVIPCNVVAVDDRGCTVRFAGGATWPLRHFGDSGLQAGQSALAIVRPEHVEITDAAQAPFAGALQETVFLGPASRHVVRLDDGTTVRVLAPAHGAVASDARVSLSISHGEGVVVPEESSKLRVEEAPETA